MLFQIGSKNWCRVRYYAEGFEPEYEEFQKAEEAGGKAGHNWPADIIIITSWCKFPQI